MTRRERTYWMEAVASFVFWPVFLAVIGRKWLLSSERSDDGNDLVESIRTRIEQLAFADKTATSLFEFRELYYRYVGLSEAYIAKSGRPLSAELLEIGGQPDATVAAKCLSRRDREKLEFHRTIARNEFVDLISNLTGESSATAQIAELGLRLSSHLNDEELAADLLALAPRNTLPLAALSGPEAEVWKTTTHSTSRIA